MEIAIILNSCIKFFNNFFFFFRLEGVFYIYIFYIILSLNPIHFRTLSNNNFGIFSLEMI